MERATVLYDVDCGFCRWTLAKLLAWDRACALRPVAIQDAAGQVLLAGMDEDRRLASWHLAFPDGRLYSAGPALVEALPLLPAGKPLGRLAGWLSPVTDRVYELVARRRAIPGRLLSRAAVRRATERIRTRSAPDSLIQDERFATSRPPAAPGNCAPA
jgi:predicted DCC family thiol-disulfide oxidoreductase YuxK